MGRFPIEKRASSKAARRGLTLRFGTPAPMRSDSVPYVKSARPPARARMSAALARVIPRISATSSAGRVSPGTADAEGRSGKTPGPGGEVGTGDVGSTRMIEVAGEVLLSFIGSPPVFGVGAPRRTRGRAPRGRGQRFWGGPFGGSQKGKGRAREAGLPRGAGVERVRAADAKRRRTGVERQRFSKARPVVLAGPSGLSGQTNPRTER